MTNFDGGFGKVEYGPERGELELRKRAFAEAIMHADSERPIELVIEDAVKIEAYLRGELRGPDDL
jgi:hypothetical protein